MTDDHDLLIRIDERTATLISSHNEMVEWMKKQDDRVCSLEACQNKWLGRDGAIVAGIAAIVSIVASGLIDISQLFK